ncbi:MAG: class I adenylate-forming enzyme family protein [Bacilli bacterium]|jgi:long-chain acyl-CoA synthetase|nr:class I adenylate-forming enzyme family protein [Bacilli bacterium]
MEKNTTLYGALLATSQQYPKRSALIYLHKKITYETLLRDVNSLAKGLLEYGVKTDDVVSVCLPNIPSAVHLLYAVNQIGAVANLIHPLMKYEQMKGIMEETKSKLLFVLDSAFNEFSNLSKIGVRVIACSPVQGVHLLLKIGYAIQNRKKIKNTAKSDKIDGYYQKEGTFAYDNDYKKDAIYLHSGGTTGKPKVVALSSFSINALASNGIDILGINETNDKYMLAVLPIFHGFGLCMGMHACLAFGACNTLMPKFHSQQVVNYLRKGQISFIIGVPILFEALLRNQNFKGSILKNLLICFVGGDFVAPSLIERFNNHMKEHGSSARLFEGYGLTEVVTVCTVNNNRFYKPGTVGKILSNVEMKVVDVDTKKDLPFSFDGELYVRGETMMNGYRFLNNESEQPFVKDEKNNVWIATGDYGSIDQEGFVTFRQRLKRIIKVSGINVFPNEIEGAVMDLGTVHECAAIAVNDEKLGNAIKLFVVLDRHYQDQSIDEEIKAIVLKRCGIYSVPRQIVYQNSLPKTLVGKVDTKALS